MKILLTGSEGFIGSHLVKKLKKYTLTTTDIRRSSRNNHYKYDLIKDKLYLDYIVRNNDIIIHCASHLGVDSIEKNKNLPFESSLMDKHIIDLCKQYNKKLIYFSTSEVYGNNDNCKETDSLCISPNNRGNYALCKLYSEKYIENEGINHIILRPFNIFGVNQDPIKGVVPKLILNALNNEPLLIDKTPQKFTLKTPYRSFCYVGDLVNIIDLMIQKDTFTRELNIYNIGNAENYISIYELCEMIKEFTNSNSEIKYAEKMTDIAFRRPNNQKVLNNFNYKFNNNFKLCLLNTIEGVKSGIGLSNNCMSSR